MSLTVNGVVTRLKPFTAAVVNKHGPVLFDVTRMCSN